MSKTDLVRYKTLPFEIALKPGDDNEDRDGDENVPVRSSLARQVVGLTLAE